MPDNDLLDAKLESLRRCLNRITEKTPPTIDELREDDDAQDILSVNLQRATQISVDIGSHLIAHRGWPAPKTMGEAFAVLAHNGILPQELATSLSKAVGFRTIAGHQYQDVDWAVVHRIATTDLAMFRTFAGAVADAWS